MNINKYFFISLLNIKNLNKKMYIFQPKHFSQRFLTAMICYYFIYRYNHDKKQKTGIFLNLESILPCNYLIVYLYNTSP